MGEHRHEWYFLKGSVIGCKCWENLPIVEAEILLNSAHQLEADNAALKEKVKSCEVDNASLQRQVERYNELIMFVATKHPNESRHETAMRYIVERENQNLGPNQALEAGGE